jgi:single-stranded DNA-binding protein
MIQVHASGRLVRDPEQKTSKNGKPYTQALMASVTSDNELTICPSPA